MNGNDLLQALNYVDEQYIAEADTAAAARRVKWWKPAAAMAAMLCLILAAAWQWNAVGMKAAKMELAVSDTSAQTMRTNEAKTASMDMAFEEAVPEAASAVWEITVRVLHREEDALVCAVVESPIKSLPPDTEICLPITFFDYGTVGMATFPYPAGTLLTVQFRPEEMNGNWIAPLEIWECE